MTQITQSRESKRVEIDFLFLDLDVCTRCKGTDASLAMALESIGHVLRAAGVDVVVRKTLVDTEAKARELEFLSSPTLRVDGRDIALELRESSCESCGEACGCQGTVDCRVWVYRGKEYTVAPVPMIVDAILTAVYAGRVVQERAMPNTYDVPENLRRLLAGKATQQPAACCPPEDQASCCEATEKETCCGTAVQSQTAACGCR